jgi:hypothetical protein
MVTARRRARRKSAAAIKRARSELINLQSRVQALDRIAQTAEALQWSAKYCAELQVRIDAATRALSKARP